MMRGLAIAAGLALAATAFTPAIAAAAHTSLTAHMIRHLLLLQIAPLLLMAGWRPRGAPGTAASRAALGWICGVTAMTIWLAPPLFHWMMAASAHLVFADTTLILSGALFWRPVFSSRERRLSPAAVIAYLFTACLASTIAGVAIAFAAPGLYAMGAASAADQQLAGLVMWMPCCGVYVAVIMATLGRWYGGDDETHVLPGDAGARWGPARRLVADDPAAADRGRRRHGGVADVLDQRTAP
jgi:cytochrome c oxidase assembly factor CtaG